MSDPVMVVRHRLSAQQIATLAQRREMRRIRARELSKMPDAGSTLYRLRCAHSRQSRAERMLQLRLRPNAGPT